VKARKFNGAKRDLFIAGCHWAAPTCPAYSMADDRLLLRGHWDVLREIGVGNAARESRCLDSGE
jgi:hypothetical protein